MHPPVKVKIYAPYAFDTSTIGSPHCVGIKILRAFRSRNQVDSVTRMRALAFPQSGCVFSCPFFFGDRRHKSQRWKLKPKERRRIHYGGRQTPLDASHCHIRKNKVKPNIDQEPPPPHRQGHPLGHHKRKPKAPLPRVAQTCPLPHPLLTKHPPIPRDLEPNHVTHDALSTLRFVEFVHDCGFRRRAPF